MKHLLKNKYKSIVCILLGMFLLTQVSNAYAWAWLLRPLVLGGGARAATTATVVRVGGVQATKSNITRNIVKNGISTAVTVPLLTFQGSANASSFEYNSSGAKFYENGYLLNIGKSCDTYSSTYGKGKWGWSEKGWWVAFFENEDGITAFEYKENLPKMSQSIMDRCEITD